MEMEEISFKGYPYTWSNNRTGTNFVEERLDLFFVSLVWASKYPRSQSLRIPVVSSDDCMIFLDTNCEMDKGKIRLYFDFWLVKKDGFSQIVAHAWNIGCFSYDLYSIQGRLRNVRLALLKWKKVNESNSRKVVSLHKEQLNSMALLENADPTIVDLQPLDGRRKRDIGIGVQRPGEKADKDRSPLRKAKNGKIAE
ncbi:Unknown protein [Striga hermonthica]|uniref:Uncharacterized protein n=1 Tax=Striga hermonthica TaxID=68872 RepID=A0A9N7MPP8_STRHE|nr:Unknown protein [Striga hermonthica]